MPDSPFLTFSPLVQRVHAALPDQEIYLVGGAVRDALLSKQSHDLDFAVPEHAIAIARQVANVLGADFYVLDESFDAARVIVPSPAIQTGDQDHENSAAHQSRTIRDVLDFSSFRPAKLHGDKALAPYGNGANDRSKSIEADLRGRDFTINAIAYNLRTGSMLDPLKGATDLRAKTLRACAAYSLSDDPVRILRGVRLAAALGFRIEDETRQAMKDAVSGLPDISAERQRDELFKILDGQRPDASIRALEALGALPYFLPELVPMKGVEQSAPHVQDVWEHTLSVLRYLDGIVSALSMGHTAEQNNDLFTGLLSLRLGRFRERFANHFEKSLSPERSMRALLFLAVLYHDVSKPTTRTVEESGRVRFFGHDANGAKLVVSRARSFNLSNDEVERLQAIVAHHMRFHFHVSRLEAEQKEPSRKSIYRFFRDAGEAGVDLMLLGLADLRGTRGPALAAEQWGHALEVARIFLENYWEKPEETVAPPRLIDGNEIMQEYKLKPGPVIGQLLEAVREAQAMGKVSTREDAFAFGREWLEQRSLMKDGND